jgi:hypothetical protein
VGALGLGASAGCVGTLPGVGDGGDGGSDAPSYATPLYDPGQVVSAPTRAFVSHDLATLYERRELYPDPITEQIERADESTDAVSIADLERVTGFGHWQETTGGLTTTGAITGAGAVLLEGSFTPDTLLERLRSSRSFAATLESAGTVDGHDLYTVDTVGGAGSAAMALSESSVYAGGTAEVEATGEDATRAMLDGDAGYYEGSDTARRLMDAMGEATTVFGAEFEADQYAPDSFDGTPGGEDLAAVVRGLRGAGSAMTLGEETVSREVVGVYAEGETPTRENVDSLLALARQGIAAQAGPNADVETLQSLIDDTEVSVEDRTVTMELSRETSGLFGGDGPVVGGVPGGPEAAVLVAPELAVVGTYVLGFGQSQSQSQAPVPSAVFDFEYDDTGETTVTHAGGDTFTAQNTRSLVVRTGGESLTSFPLPVRAGDSVTVTVDGGQTLRLVWTSPDGSRTATVGSFETPR